MSLKSQPAVEPGGIRGLLNKNPAIAAGVIIVAIVALLAYSFWPAGEPGAYFSDDDGKTWFKDSGQIPPYQKGGKEVVRAVMYSCDGGKTLFIGYLMRFTQAGKKQVEYNIKNKVTGPVNDFEVKKPGDKEWAGAVDFSKPGPGGFDALRKKDAKFKEIRDVRCPGGKGDAVVYNPDE